MTRASLVTPIPDNVYEVLIEDEWAETWRGANFLCHQDNDWGVLMFCTDEHFAKLSRCQDVYIDGAFKSSPRPYKQFVTVHGKYLGRVVPLVMCLSTGKTVGQYSRVTRRPALGRTVRIFNALSGVRRSIKPDAYLSSFLRHRLEDMDLKSGVFSPLLGCSTRSNQRL